MLGVYDEFGRVYGFGQCWVYMMSLGGFMV
jgi:hypothetical protein